MNIKYQTKALQSLRKGIEEYDKRHGWRGPIANKLKDKNWEKKLNSFKLDPTLKWHFAEITDLDDSQIEFQILDDRLKREKGIINYKNLKWSLSNKKRLQRGTN